MKDEEVSMRSRRSQGFTLIELLVVVGIIIVATALALPGINQFLKGQKLVQAGRLIQSAFNEARRAAITQRSRHWIFIGRLAGSGGNPDTFALAHYREGKGWDSTQVLKLPSTIQPVFAGGNPDDASQPLLGCGLRCQEWTDGLPPANALTAPAPGGATPAFSNGNFGLAAGVPTFEFRKDGTILPIAPCIDIPAQAYMATDIYDVNVAIEFVPPPPGTQADIILKQIGDASRRCFIDVDVNTGRVRFRVLETEKQ